jgi:hypothetical protein
MNKVTVSPTWAQTWHYANASGQIGWTIFGVVLIALAAFIVIKLGNKSVGFIILGVAILAGGFASILSKPIAIHISNDKVVEQQYLDRVGSDYILDSCYKNNLLIDASYK